MALITGLRIWHCRELWYRPAATTPIRPLAKGAALKKTKEKRKKKKERKENFRLIQEELRLNCKCTG